MPQDESWSWTKLGKGPFVGKNYAKAAVMLICMTVILGLVGAVVFSVLTLRGRLSQRSATTVGTNAGTLTQEDSHDVITETHYHLPLSDIFSEIFSFGKSQGPSGRKEHA